MCTWMFILHLIISKHCYKSLIGCSTASSSTAESTSLINSDNCVDEIAENVTPINTLPQLFVDTLPKQSFDTLPLIPSPASIKHSTLTDSITETANDKRSNSDIDPLGNNPKEMKVKCAGFTPNIDGNIYHHFPFIIIITRNIIIIISIDIQRLQ